MTSISNSCSGLSRPVPRAWHGEYGKVLGVLAVAQAPLSEDQIAAITVLSPVVTRGALQKMREVLETDEGRPASQREYSLYHRSLADFLLDRDRAEEYWLDDVAMHRLVTAHYRACRTDGWRACDEYGMRYLATHLLAGHEIARLQSLLDEDWIRMRYERGHYSYDGVLGDVELAWRAAEQATEPDRRRRARPPTSHRTCGGRSLFPASAAWPPAFRPTCSARWCAAANGPPSRAWSTRGACRRESRAA